MEALKLIPVIFSISSFNCTVDYFNELRLGENYKPLNQILNICEFVQNDNRFDEDLRENVHLYVNNCTQELTKTDCTGIIEDLMKSFNSSIRQTIDEFDVEERETTKIHEVCIYDKMHEYKIYRNFLKFFTYPEHFLAFWNETLTFTKEMDFPIRLARILCKADEIYSMKFDEHKHHIKKLSQIEPCNIQYLIDQGFITGKLEEVPQNCEDKNKQFLNTLNPIHLKWNYPFQKFFTLERDDLMDCFIEKVEQQKLFPKLIGIEYSYALQSEELDIDETKKKFVQMRKYLDEIAFECYAQIQYE